jgi:hypothetical protein
MAGVRPRPLSRARVMQKHDARMIPTRLKLFIFGTQFGVQQASPSALLAADTEEGLQPRRDNDNEEGEVHLGTENMNRKQLQNAIFRAIGLIWGRH